MRAPRRPHLLPKSKRPSLLPRQIWRALRRMPLVLSYPKAGRTWLRVMLDELGARAEYTHFGAGVKSGRPLEEIRANPLWCARRPSLLLVRDPRDTLVSSFFQASRRRRTWSGTLPEFVREPRFGIEKLARWNLMWADLGCRREAFGIVEYEALHRTPRETLRAGAELLGVRADDAALDRALAAGRIEVMREGERSGAYRTKYSSRLEPRDPDDPASFKVRRGVVGGHRDDLSEGDQAWCNEVLERLDYWPRLQAALALRGLPALQLRPADGAADGGRTRSTSTAPMPASATSGSSPLA